jgi:hypothetical protein
LDPTEDSAVVRVCRRRRTNIEFPVGAEKDHAAVVIPARGLRLIALVRWLRGAIMLKRPQRDESMIELQPRLGEVEPIDTIPHQRRVENVVGVGAEHIDVAALLLSGDERIDVWRNRPAAPEQVHPGIDGEIRVKRNAEKAAFGRVVHREVQERLRLRDTVDDPAHTSGVLLQNEQIVRADERDARRQGQARDDDAQ